MINGNEPAFSKAAFYDRTSGCYDRSQEGLTKREYFAAMAMQGMLANINQSIGKPNVNEKSLEESLKRQNEFIEEVAAKSIQYSDALIKQLNKQQ